LRNFWIVWATTIVLACFSDAVAQTSYTVTDLGILRDDWNLSCGMALNNQGWTLIMNGLMDPMSLFIGANPVAGRATIDIGELKIDLRTLGGQNSWMNWGGINDRGEAVGEADTSVTTAETIANSAHTVRVARFFGKTATSALSPR
jgi:hypothetical protein